MNDVIVITNVSFASASHIEAEGGLLGWVSFTLNGKLRIQGIGLRRTVNGRYTLSFPARPDGQGGQHFYVRPLDDRARRDIEHQVFRALGLEEKSLR